MIRLRYPVAYDRSRGFGVVAIGRNEGDRLKRCLASALCAAAVVYVDSGSTDGSVAWATATGVDVVVLQGYFTAARARNAGFIRLNEIAPSLEFVQFLDGDCELLEDWPQQAISFLERHEKVCAVFGRRRERFPDRSIYNRLCDKEWNTPIGEALAFGGDVMIRAQTLGDAGGYREDLIAGEEPELCVRLRSHGNHIWRLDFDMTMHDANIVRFGQWWRRNVRSGYAFAQGAHLHGASGHWVWESRRALIWGLWLPILCVGVGSMLRPWGLLIFLVYPLQLLRRFRHASGSGPIQLRLKFVYFEMLARFPEALGQLKFTRDRLLRRQGSLIEYK
jgi:glycosyltransferase involved in cell wall biosynthesis